MAEQSHSGQLDTNTLALRGKLNEMLKVKEPPRKVALSFAVGIFIGMSPLLGLHTILALVAAPLCRLNTFVTIVGVYVTNPWTIVPIYTFATWVGARVLGVRSVIPDIEWNALSLSVFISEMKDLLLPFVLGSSLVGLVSAAIGYAVIYGAVIRRRRRLALVLEDRKGQ